MDIQYTVHSCAATSFQTMVQLGGQDILASINGLVVELVSLDGSMNRTIRVQPQDVEAAKALYVIGAVIKTTDELVSLPTKVEAPSVEEASTEHPAGE